MLLVATTNNWELRSLDISAAFLQGREINGVVYLRPPKDVCSNNVIWKLKRCIYSLNDAPRAWYNRVHDEFIRLGARLSQYDSALFLSLKKGQLDGILASHVDDFACCGTRQWERDVLQRVKEKFKISSEAHGSFKYIGLEVTQNEHGVFLHQDKYVKSVQSATISTERKKHKEDELSEEEKTVLSSISGKLLWASTQTRPDIAYDACIVANHGKKPTLNKLLEANKAICKLKAVDVVLKFPPLGAPDKISVLCYSDATHASLPCGSSQGTFIIFLTGGDQVIPIWWKSKKLNRVTKSPLASETMAVNEAADSRFLVAMMVAEVFNLSKRPDVTCRTDCKSLIDALSTTHVLQDTRLLVDVARLREMVKLKVSIEWVDGRFQLADSLTKTGASRDTLLDVLEKSKIPWQIGTSYVVFLGF